MPGSAVVVSTVGGPLVLSLAGEPSLTGDFSLTGKPSLAGELSLVGGFSLGSWWGCSGEKLPGSARLSRAHPLLLQ